MKSATTLGMLALGVMLGCAIGACDRSGPATTMPGATTEERIKEEIVQAGHEIKTAATEAAQEAKPVLQKAKEESREAIHTAAEKVADWTATQPATQP